MPKRRSLIGGFILSVGLGLTGPATAIADSCAVSATPVVFGRIEEGPVQATGTITLGCTGGGAVNPFSIALSAGSGAFANRAMKNGGNSLRYNLFTGLAHVQIWGDGSAGTSLITGNIDLRGPGLHTVDETVYGLVPAQPLPPGGAYADTIVVTLTF